MISMTINLGVFDIHKAEEEKLSKICDSFLNWDSARQKIYPILLPIEKNPHMLNELVWIKKMDLAMVFGFRCYNIYESPCCIMVKKTMLDVWNVSAEELYRIALNNMKNDGYKIRNTLDFLSDVGITELFTEEEIKQVSLYSLTNKDSYYGAAGILYADFLRSNINEDCYIFPSSVDEVLIYPIKSRDIEVDLLHSMIEDINRDYVSDSGFLSNSLYFYDSKTGEVSVVERNG